MTQIVQFLLTFEPSTAAESVDRLNGLVSTLAPKAGATSAHVFATVPGATRGTAHADLIAEAPFDAVLEFRGEHVSVEEVVSELTKTFALDLASSAVLSGIEHAFVAGEDAYRLQVFVAASTALTHDEFIDHWLNTHGNLIRPTRTGPPYKQFHADPIDSGAASREFGSGIRHLAGAAVAGYPDVESYQRALGNRERMAPIIEDELRFIDHANSVVGFYRAL